jgi:hypothetical protein
VGRNELQAVAVELQRRDIQHPQVAQLADSLRENAPGDRVEAHKRNERALIQVQLLQTAPGFRRDVLKEFFQLGEVTQGVAVAAAYWAVGQLQVCGFLAYQHRQQQACCFEIMSALACVQHRIDRQLLSNDRSWKYLILLAAKLCLTKTVISIQG